MVLEGDQVEPGLIGQPGEVHDVGRPLAGRSEERAEGELVPVVAHCLRTSCGWRRVLDILLTFNSLRLNYRRRRAVVNSFNVERL